jgi:hypothetical protein
VPAGSLAKARFAGAYTVKRPAGSRLAASAPTVDLFYREGCLGLLSAKLNKGSSQCWASRTIARTIIRVAASRGAAAHPKWTPASFTAPAAPRERTRPPSADNAYGTALITPVRIGVRWPSARQSDEVNK